MKKNILLEEKIIKRKRIPILIEEKEWRALFLEAPSKEMDKKINELKELLTEEKKNEQQLAKQLKYKKMLMEKILKLSDKVNSQGDMDALKELENTKITIMDINQEIEHLQQRLELLPEEIEHLNFELLKETVDMAYTDIRTMGKEIPKLTDEILYLRQQLSEKWEQKTSMETRVDMLYSYLHNTLGYEETDKLDKEFL